MMSDQDKEFEQWATQQGLIRNAFGITAEHTGIDIAKSAWQDRSARIAELEAEVARLADALADVLHAHGVTIRTKPPETVMQAEAQIAVIKSAVKKGKSALEKYEAMKGGA